MPHSKYIEQFNAFPDILYRPRTIDSRGLHTAKWAAQTTREFIQAISDTVDEIPDLRETITEKQKEGAEALRPELLELYKVLRRQGYSHYDLVA